MARMTKSSLSCKQPQQYSVCNLPWWRVCRRLPYGNLLPRTLARRWAIVHSIQSVLYFLWDSRRSISTLVRVSGDNKKGLVLLRALWPALTDSKGSSLTTWYT